MNARERSLAAMARYKLGHNDRVAAFPPLPKEEGSLESPGDTRRNIPPDHDYDPRALKPMAKALWAASVSLGHALTAYRHLSRLKSTSVSPDGMLGGRGFVMGVKDVRQKLHEACEALSCISDTLHDEIQAPHWQPKLAQLDENDAEDVSRFVEESQDYLENPEEEAEGKIKAIEEANDKPGSKVPDGGEVETQEVSIPKPAVDKQASTVTRVASRFIKANSTLPVDTLPGPRVNHLGPAEGQGPWGSYNVDERPSDNWEEDERTYDYPSEWENDLRQADSVLPQDDTPTEAWDWGLGFGAKGQGAGDRANPSGEGNGTKGVWGPQSGLPGAPAQSSGDTTPALDNALNERHGQGLMPGDVVGPPARADYYDGPKDNLVQAAFAWAQSVLPGEESVPGESDLGMIDTGYKSEDLNTPYVRWDWTTENNRPEHQHGRPEELPWAHDEEVPR